MCLWNSRTPALYGMGPPQWVYLYPEQWPLCMSIVYFLNQAVPSRLMLLVRTRECHKAAVGDIPVVSREHMENMLLVNQRCSGENPTQKWFEFGRIRLRKKDVEDAPSSTSALSSGYSGDDFFFWHLPLPCQWGVPPSAAIMFPLPPLEASSRRSSFSGASNPLGDGSPSTFSNGNCYGCSFQLFL